MFKRLKTVTDGGQSLKTVDEWDVTRRLLGAGCGKSCTSGSEGEVHRSNADIDSNVYIPMKWYTKPYPRAVNI
jgi:hypothetical protein